MKNQMIGIAGVFSLTFFLLALRYVLSLGRSNRNRYDKLPQEIADAQSNRRDLEDDSWLLWSPDSETSSPKPAGEAPRTPRAPRHNESSPLRVVTGR